MQIRRKFIDIPPEERQEKAHFIWSRNILYVLLAAIIAGWFTYDYALKNIITKDRLQIEVIQKDIELKEPPYLPDISGFTVENIEKKIRPPVNGRVVFENISLYPEFGEFLEDDAPRRLRLLQRRINPKALVIESGHYTLTGLYEEVKKIDPEGKLLEKIGDKYILRVPLGVLIGASLAITDKDTPELLLSKQHNAFLVNAGEMFIVRTGIIGWDEVKQAKAMYVSKEDYRPFVTAWGGGHLYVAGARMECLGYLKGKSYGLSYSTCTSCLKRNPFLPHATGAVVDTYFHDMFYGFYSYEAHDVAIVGNKYEDNVIYAIDPHDRSRRLIIANNETFNTHYKHGIIISREVNDSWIFGNYTHHNKGSGIMIDRLSINNVIANNVAEYNEQDGLTFFESQDNITWGNIFRNNKRNGVLVRNSWNIKMYNDEIMLNNGVAVEVYAVNLVGKELHRDFELDPFTLKADATLVNTKIKSSGPAIFKFAQTDFLDLSNVKIWAGTHLFPNNFVYKKQPILDNIEKPGTVVRVGTGYKSTDTVKFPTKHE